MPVLRSVILLTVALCVGGCPERPGKKKPDKTETKDDDKKAAVEAKKAEPAKADDKAVAPTAKPDAKPDAK
jgi:hypothetical protein